MLLKNDLQPKKITDILDNIDIYLAEMRKNEDKIEIPNELIGSLESFFRRDNPDNEKLKMLAVFLADHTYRYAADVILTDDYTIMYFAAVISRLWDELQARGVNTFYILDNKLREDRFMLTVQLFALSGIAVVTPYSLKDTYNKYMTIGEQAKWALSFSKEDFDPKKIKIIIHNSEESHKIEVLDLIGEYIKHARNIIYIEKDDNANFLEDVIEIAKDSKYMSFLRNKAPDDSHVTVIE